MPFHPVNSGASGKPVCSQDEWAVGPRLPPGRYGARCRRKAGLIRSDISYDRIAATFEAEVYEASKGYIRLQALWEDLVAGGGEPI